MAFRYDPLHPISVTDDSGVVLCIANRRDEDAVPYELKTPSLTVQFRAFHKNRWIEYKALDGRDRRGLYATRIVVVEPSLRKAYRTAYETTFQRSPGEEDYQGFRELVRLSLESMNTRGGTTLTLVPEFDVVFVDKYSPEMRLK